MDAPRRIKGNMPGYTDTLAVLVRAPPAVPGTKMRYVVLVKDYTGLYKGKSYEKWAETLIAMAMDVNKPRSGDRFREDRGQERCGPVRVPPPGRTHQGARHTRQDIFNP